MCADTTKRLDSNGCNKLIPLESTDPPALDYPTDAIPGVLGAMVESVIKHVQCPAAIAGQSVLGAASLAVQGIADVLVDGRRCPISLYCMTIALSGERKSSTDGLVLRRHQEWERQAWDEYKQMLADYQQQLRDYKEDSKKNRAKRWKNEKDSNLTHLLPKLPDAPPEEPLPPEAPQLISSDATYEGLFRAFGIGRPSQGLFSDEGGTFLSGWGMKPENAAYTISSLSKLWDGAPIRRVRGGEDTNPPLYNRRLACHLLVTPVIAEKTLSELMLGQGFLPRFLIARPASRIGFREYQRTDPTQDINCIRFWDRMGELLKRPVKRCKDGGCDTRPLVLTPEAHDVFIQMYNRFELSCQPGKDQAEAAAFISKAAENMVRMAAVFTLVEDAEADMIGLVAITSAARLMDKYYLPEAVRFIQRAPEDRSISDAKKLLVWMREQRSGHTVTIRDICRSGPRCARKSATVARRLVGLLVDHGYLIKLADNSCMLSFEAIAGDTGDTGDIPHV